MFLYMSLFNRQSYLIYEFDIYQFILLDMWKCKLL